MAKQLQNMFMTLSPVIKILVEKIGAEVIIIHSEHFASFFGPSVKLQLLKLLIVRLQASAASVLEIRLSLSKPSQNSESIFSVTRLYLGCQLN